MRSAQTRSPRLLWAAAAVTALVLASCGDDSDETVSLTSQPDPTTVTTITTTTTAPDDDDEPRRLDFEGTLEPGVIYDYPMGLHCGLDVFGEFNGTAWALLEAPGATLTAGPARHHPTTGPSGPKDSKARPSSSRTTASSTPSPTGS